MITYNLYKKRDGQSWQLIGDYYCSNFEEAKLEFAKHCWNDLLEGKHGDNYIEDEEGIYYNGELELSRDVLTEGITFFSNDVYQWEIRDVKKYHIYDTESSELICIDFDDSDKIYDLYPIEEGFQIVEMPLEEF